MKNTPSKNNIGKFETSLGQLQSLIEEMESNNLSLDASLSAFEKGIKLTRSLQKTIAEAEQTVQMLTEQGGNPIAEKFDPEEKG